MLIDVVRLSSHAFSCVDTPKLHGLSGTATPIFAPTNATCNGKPGPKLSRLREAEGIGRGVPGIWRRVSCVPSGGRQAVCGV